MEFNDKTVSQIAGQLGLSGQKNISKRDIDYLSSKSDAELERELYKIKEQLKANNVSYEKQVAMIRTIAPMLDPKQRARLNKVMEILKK